MRTRSGLEFRLRRPAAIKQKAQHKTSSKLPQRHRCTACAKFSHTHRFPCTHRYCKECVRKLFLACFSNRQLAPVKCCGQAAHTALSSIALTPKEALVSIILFSSVLGPHAPGALISTSSTEKAKLTRRKTPLLVLTLPVVQSSAAHARLHTIH